MSPPVRAFLTRHEVETATWEAFLADVPLTWLPRPPVPMVAEPIPVGEAVDSDFGAFAEAAGAAS